MRAIRIIGTGIVTLVFCLAAAQTPGRNAYPQQFAGIWKAERQGRPVLILDLHEEAVQLAGTIRLNKFAEGSSAETTNQSEALTEAEKLHGVHIDGPYLFFDITFAEQVQHWRMQVTSPGVGTLQRLDPPSQENIQPIAIARETIYGPSTPSAAKDIAETPADLRQFAGTWKTMYHAHPFITLVLQEENGRLAGSCEHSRSINWDKHGELTVVSEELAEDNILKATASGNILSLTIGNNDDPDEPVKIALTLTGPDQAEGVLLGLPRDVPKQKPWIFTRAVETK